MTATGPTDRLAKDRLDVGLVTADPTALAFVGELAGPGEPEELRVSREVVQHRFDLRGSIIKVNIGPARAARSGHIQEIVVAADIGAPSMLVGPGGERARLVPSADASTEHLDVVMGVSDLGTARDFYRGLDWPLAGDRVLLGRSGILLQEVDTSPGSVGTWDYLTIQVFDCDAETARAVDAGASVLFPPRTAGTVARYSIVADPFGNAIELSQRASLTGPLPPD